MDRRRFLKNTAVFITLPALFQGQVIRVLAAGNGFNPAVTNGRSLVLIQLDGGNDGLNMLIPLDKYDNLANARPSILLPEPKILRITDLQGLHPSMTEMNELFNEEKLMFIQNVGYPEPNLSHFRSKEIILSGSDSQQVIASGWFGRYLGMLYPDYPDGYPDSGTPHPLAITIGSSSSPTCQGDTNNMGIVLQNLNTSYDAGSGGTQYPDTPYGTELKYISEVMLSTEKYLGVVSEVADLSETVSTRWPADGTNSLADKLKVVARLITGGMQTPVYVVNLGGFDTHAGQVVADATETGTHADLLQKVSEACAAFQDELSIHGKEENVISLVYSEFGRRIASNNSVGTDHGTAFPMMLFGSRVNPVVFGQNPDIPENVDKKENLPMENDFRSVYASILHSWFEIDGTEIQDILFQEFETIPILKSAVGTAVTADAGTDLRLFPVYPNPVKTEAEIHFVSSGGKVSLQLFTLDGSLAKVLLDRKVPRGSRFVRFNRNGLSKGHYLLVLQNGMDKESQVIALQ